MTSYNQYFVENPDQIKCMVGNTYWGRSGSFLLCSLFDGHPEVLTLPFSNYSYLTRLFLNHLNLFSDLTPEEFARRILDDIPYLTEEGNTKDPWSIINSPGTNIQKIGDDYGKDIKIGAKRTILQQNLSKIFHLIKERGQPLTLSTLINSLHISYALSKGKTIKTKNPVILYCLHDYDVEIIKKLSEEYTKFILMISVRTPTKTLDSHMYHHLYEFVHGNHMWTVQHLYKLLYDAGQRIQGLKKEQQIAVKFEDVHNKTDLLMKTLCKKFQINWDPILLQSTIDGKIWWTERSKQMFSGPNPDFMLNQQSYKVLKKLDFVLFSSLFDQYVKSWMYECNHPIKPLLITKAISYFLLKFPFLSPLFLLSAKMELKKALRSRQFKTFRENFKNDSKNFNSLIKVMIEERQKMEPVSLLEV